VILLKDAWLQIIVATIFLGLVVLDFNYFVFHPFQVGICVDIQAKTEQDRAILRKITIEQEIE